MVDDYTDGQIPYRFFTSMACRKECANAMFRPSQTNAITGRGGYITGPLCVYTRARVCVLHKKRQRLSLIAIRLKGR